MNADIARRVQGIVEQIAGPQRVPADAGPHTPFGENGFWLDSVDLLEVIIACQEAFEVELAAERDLTPEHLRTIGTLAALLESRIG